MERCPHCGGQALGCVGFDPHDPRRQAWDGRWPGEADCERLGFFVNGDRALPDINRLFAECVWNPERQRWEPDPRPLGARTGPRRGHRWVAPFRPGPRWRGVATLFRVPSAPKTALRAPQGRWRALQLNRGDRPVPVPMVALADGAPSGGGRQTRTRPVQSSPAPDALVEVCTLTRRACVGGTRSGSWSCGHPHFCRPASCSLFV